MSDDQEPIDMTEEEWADRIINGTGDSAPVIGWDKASGEDVTVHFTFWNGEYARSFAPPVQTVAKEHAPIRQFSKIRTALQAPVALPDGSVTTEPA